MQRRDLLHTDPTLANRFLSHQLSDEELARLEAELLTDPELVRELEATARFKVGLHRLRETGELDALLEPPRRSYRVLLQALAAVLLVSLVTFWLLPAAPTNPLSASVEQLTDRTGPLSVDARTYSVLRVRGGLDRTVIELPPSRQAIKLRILPRPELVPPRVVSLSEIREQGGVEKLGSVTVAQADAEGFITLFIDSSRLQEGNYVLTVAGATEVPEEMFLVEVVRSSNSN